jgi:hypothetical protein
MESLSDVDMTENSDDVIDAESQISGSKFDDSICGFRGDSEQFRGNQQHKCERTDTKNHAQQSDFIDSIIPSIIADDLLACQVTDLDPTIDRSRFRVESELRLSEESLKPSHLEKAKPGHPETNLLQDFTISTFTNNWLVGNLNNVVVHQCNDSCSCMSAGAGMYADETYYSQGSF